MKGHIRKRGNGYAIVVELPRDPSTGKRRQKWHYVTGTKRDAERTLRELLTSMDNGTYIKPKKMTFGVLLEEWLNDYAAVQVSQRTLESYRDNIRRNVIPALGALPVTELEPTHLQRYYGNMLASGRSDGQGGLSARTVLYHHRIISKALKNAVKMGKVVRNVADSVDAPRVNRAPMKTLSVEDVPKLLDALQGSPHYVYFCVLLYCGLRRAEAIALKWKNVDLVESEIQVVETAYKLHDKTWVVKEPKTKNSRRQVALPRSLTELLGKYREDKSEFYQSCGRILGEEDYVFSRPDGSPIDPNCMTQYFRKLLKRAGLPHIRLHDLRHTHATLMLKAGIHPKIVSERLGHASIAITLDTYSHVLPGLQKAAAEKFDRLMDEGSKSENTNKNVCKMFASDDGVETEPPGSRTQNLMIKRYQKSVPKRKSE